MESRNRTLLTVAATAALVGSAPTGGAVARANDYRSALPAAVAKAIDDNRPGAEIRKVDVEKEHGFKFYDIEFKGGQGEMDVAEDGTVLNIATSVELKDVPEAAATVIQRAARGTTIKQLQKSEVRARIADAGGRGKLLPLSPPEYEYEAELARGGEIEVAADGRILKAPKSMGQ